MWRFIVVLVLVVSLAGCGHSDDGDGGGGGGYAHEDVPRQAPASSAPPAQPVTGPAAAGLPG